MVKGLEKFKEFFQSDAEHFVLIGGSACDLHFEQLGMNFRATQDLDIVLCVEALSGEFVERFWEFIRLGKYTIRQRADGKKEFYRFIAPQEEGYPRMLELFSRRPDVLPFAPHIHLTPIPTDEEISSLSAILLDEEYYRFILSQRRNIDGLSVVSPEGLVVLKARAWMDLCARRMAGYAVDSGNIRKHRNDIIDLLPLVVPRPLPLESGIRKDMVDFLALYKAENIDLKNRMVPRGITKDYLMSVLKILLGL